MKRKMAMVFIMITTLTVMLTSCGLSPSQGNTTTSSSGGTIIVGSKSFTENILIGDMMYDLLSANLKGVIIQNKSNLGGTMVPWNAIQSGQIDMYTEYTGTGLVDILKQSVEQNPDQVYNTVKQQYPSKFHIDWMQPLGFNDTYAIAVPKTLAAKYNLKTISDLRAVAPQLVFGAEPEYYTRPDGYPGLTKTYNLHFKSTKSINVGLKYEAAGGNQVQVIDVFSTDGQLIQYNMVVLQDDQNFFPPYYAVPIVREDILHKYPQVADILNKLAGKLDNTAMQKLNYAVDVQHKAATDVAKQFLVSVALLSA
jgi:osmoprotectant transport system substrate-binding protein